MPVGGIEGPRAPLRMSTPGRSIPAYGPRLPTPSNQQAPRGSLSPRALSHVAEHPSIHCPDMNLSGVSECTTTLIKHTMDTSVSEDGGEQPRQRTVSERGSDDGRRERRQERRDTRGPRDDWRSPTRRQKGADIEAELRRRRPRSKSRSPDDRASKRSATSTTRKRSRSRSRDRTGDSRSSRGTRDRDSGRTGSRSTCKPSKTTRSRSRSPSSSEDEDKKRERYSRRAERSEETTARPKPRNQDPSRDRDRDRNRDKSEKRKRTDGESKRYGERSNPGSRESSGNRVSGTRRDLTSAYSREEPRDVEAYDPYHPTYDGKRRESAYPPPQPQPNPAAAYRPERPVQKGMKVAILGSKPLTCFDSGDLFKEPVNVTRRQVEYVSSLGEIIDTIEEEEHEMVLLMMDHPYANDRDDAWEDQVAAVFKKLRRITAPAAHVIVVLQLEPKEYGVAKCKALEALNIIINEYAENKTKNYNYQATVVDNYYMRGEHVSNGQKFFKMLNAMRGDGDSMLSRKGRVSLCNNIVSAIQVAKPGLGAYNALKRAAKNGAGEPRHRRETGYSSGSDRPSGRTESAYAGRR